jgi:hypothetical protein
MGMAIVFNTLKRFHYRRRPFLKDFDIQEKN